jgi:hypothetical protein
LFAPWRGLLSRLNLKGRRDMPSDTLLAHNVNTAEGPRPLGCWLFDDWLAELPLAETLEENGVDLIAVYLLTPDAYSLPRLPYILDLIKPPRTLIVLNEWGFEADQARAAFAPILANRVVAAAEADGARIVTMPHLDDAEVLDAIRALRRDGVTDALTDRPVLSAWLNRMDVNFAPIAGWLA